jgi:N6-L-threonylcarbamoyladenine synthase
MRVRFPVANLVIAAGGVASNAAIRESLSRTAEANGYGMVAPPVRLCSDNAVMVAWAGIERLRLGLRDGMDVSARPRWPVEELAG